MDVMDEDRLRSGLRALAPDVDEAASRRLLDDRLTGAAEPGPAGGARFLPVAAAVLLMAAGTTALVAVQGGDDDPQPSAPSPPVLRTDDRVRPAPAFEVLDVQNGPDIGVLRAAVDDGELAALWANADLRGEPPTVDFQRWIVVSIAIPDDACPPTLAGFDVSGPVLTPQFVETAGGCDQPLIPKTYVAAIERSELAPSFTLRLPADRPHGFDEVRLDVAVPPVEPAPDQLSAPTFEVLDVQDGPDMGVLRAAVDDRQLAALWEDAGLRGDPPAVDFRRSIVVSVAIPDDACPPTLAGFNVSGRMLTPRFVETAGECLGPLVPKTYIVALDRAELEPSFTLRLPGDGVFAEQEQRLAVDLPTADAAPPPSTEPPSSPPEGAEWRFPLPAPGDAESVLAPDGTPLWIVHHDDGTASALPAVVHAADSFGNEGLSVDQAAVIVIYSPSNGTFVGVVTYDAHGRALNSGRDDDLADFTATIDGDHVVVRRSGLSRVPGDPDVPKQEDAGRGRPRQPELPPVRPLDDTLVPGWQRVDATLVSTQGEWRLCAIDPSVPVNELDRCDDDAVLAHGLDGGHERGYTGWFFGPLVVFVDDGGEIDLIAPTGGYAATVD